MLLSLGSCETSLISVWLTGSQIWQCSGLDKRILMQLLSFCQQRSFSMSNWNMSTKKNVSARWDFYIKNNHNTSCLLQGRSDEYGSPNRRRWHQQEWHKHCRENDFSHHFWSFPILKPRLFDERRFKRTLVIYFFTYHLRFLWLSLCSWSGSWTTDVL